MKKIILFLILAIIFAGCIKPLEQFTDTPPAMVAQYTKEQAAEMALSYIKNAPTFKFDGIEESAKVIEVLTLGCPYCWAVNIEFQCRHGGYGDRTGKFVTQAITTHRAYVVVQEGNVTIAKIDDVWDELAQKMIGEEIRNISLALTKNAYGGDEHVQFTFDTGSGGAYMSDRATGNPWEIYKKEGEEWKIIQAGAIFGCYLTECTNGTPMTLCIEPKAPLCTFTEEVKTSSWNQKYFKIEDAVCGDGAYKKFLQVRAESGKYKVRYYYAKDDKCLEIKYLEREFEIL